MLVAIEGIDGSGKTSVCAAMEECQNKCAGNDKPWIFSHEPCTQTPTGAYIQQVLDGAVQGVEDTMLGLFCAARGEHLRLLTKKAEQQGQTWDTATIIIDRYTMSTMVYQQRTHSIEALREHIKHTVEPDLLVFIDVPPSVAASRNPDKYPHWGNLDSIRDTYLTVFEDSSLPIGERRCKILPPLTLDQPQTIAKYVRETIELVWKDQAAFAQL